MKIFGGKKSGRQIDESANYTTSEEIQEVIVPAVQEPEVQKESVEEVPVISVLPEIEESTADAAEASEVTEEKDREDGLISSIAEAVGVVPSDEAETSVEQGEIVSEPAPQKMSRKEKKAAKKAEKETAKADKKAQKAAEKAAKKEARKWSLGKKILFVCILLMAVGATVFAGYFVSQMWMTEEALDIYSADFTGEIQYADGEFENPGSTDGEEGQDNTVAVNEDRKDGCYTFLVAARDVASGCTDVIIVGMFDTVNNKINMVSIPRDTMINKGLLKVNTAYQGDLASGGNGIDGLLKEMKKILGFDIDSYAIVDVEAVAKLIDAIGGVYFDVPMDMVYKDGSQNLDINIKAGYQKLSGEDAVKVLRFRKGYANGDLGRIETQHDFIKALADQILDVGNIPNLGTAIEIYQEHVQTNLTAGNILFYAKNFLEMDTENIQFIDMPQMMGGLVNNQSFVFINIDKWINVINEYLNPYKEDITQRNVSIKTSADQGESFYYSAGA